MTNLTEKWKKGELEDGCYYVKIKGDEDYMLSREDDHWYEFGWDCWFFDSDIVEILASIPSYDHFVELIEKDKENQKLKKEHELFAELCERLLCIEEKEWENIVKTKSKKQQIEFLYDKTKFSFLALFDENQKLYERIEKLEDLLIECRKYFDGRMHDFIIKSMLTKIDEVLK